MLVGFCDFALESSLATINQVNAFTSSFKLV